MGGDDNLAAAISLTQPLQFRKESSIEDHRIAAMVTISRHDDLAGDKRVDELRDRAGGQMGLVGDPDQGRWSCPGQRPNADPDRAVDTALRPRIRHNGQR